MTGRLIALGLCVTLALVLKFAGITGTPGDHETQQADRSTCETPKYWTHPSPDADCYEVPTICPNGGQCETAPRLWTNTKPEKAVYRL
ncbi:hypothetical protein [uncultured Roseobacter sp.]|uniref:hypothetical protein n=1 Tax=uncultured Roseobacter sp. TaxID=114847 RepID=UPI00260242F3|nr:hypothetical protein [uncultured Roseobacter sp.]